MAYPHDSTLGLTRKTPPMDNNSNDSNNNTDIDTSLVIRGALVLVTGLAVIIGLIGFGVVRYTGNQTQVCTVNDKDRSSSKNGSSIARVYTEQCGVLSAEDRFFIGYFDSADVYSGIEAGKTYEFHTLGRRVPLMSSFPTITSATAVSPPA